MNRRERMLEASGLVSCYEAATGRRHSKRERGHAFVAAGLQLAHGEQYDDLRAAALRYARHCRATGERPVDACKFYAETWWTFARQTAQGDAQATSATRHDS